MARSKKSSSSGKHKQLASSLLCLPQELVTEIIAHVATSSFSDFLTTKFVCKDFHELPEQEEDYLYRHVSLDKFPIAPWFNIEQHSQFFKKCHENKNPEALYRQGVVHYFSGAKLYCAMKSLEESANAGHMRACYAMGIIFVFCGGELKQKGIALLGSMKKSKILRQKMEDYRDSLKSMIREIWINPLIVKKTSSCCTMQHQKKKSGWSMFEIEEDDEIMCEGCASDLEVTSICNIL